MAAFAGAMLARQPVIAPPAGALTDVQAREAVEWTNARYDALSIGIIQHIAAVPANRVFDEATAQAVATFQRDRGLLVDGKVGHQTLTAAFPERVGQSAHDQLIHIVADLCDIDITTDISAVRFDQTVATRGATEFDPSGLRVIKLGATAFQSSRILRDTINAQRRGAAPAAPAAGPAPAILDPLDAGLALLLDQVALPHPNSVRSIRALVGAPRANVWNEELVQHVAAFQQANGLPGNGRVDVATLEVLVRQLIATNDFNGVIRLIVDFFDFDDQGNLISIYFDPNETANAETLPLSSGEENQPASIQVGPPAFTQPFAGLVHTIEHEFSHVRLMRQNETDIPTQEFLSEGVEMTSPITPQEDIAGFQDDADRCLREWNKMPQERQIRHRDRFVELRQAVRDRHSAATPADQATLQPTLNRWNAQALPVGPPAPP
jgi:peptidoglycan hydrolase-like protein with peptidoglycan-binding domain